MGSIALTHAVSRCVGEIGPFKYRKYFDQKASRKINEGMFESENVCSTSAPISVVTGETGDSQVMEMLWLCQCDAQGKNKQNYHLTQMREAQLQVTFASLPKR